MLTVGEYFPEEPLPLLFPVDLYDLWGVSGTFLLRLSFFNFAKTKL